MLYRAPGICGSELIHAARAGQEIRVRFLSPTSLIYQKHPARLPEFHILARSLLRRISNLARGHCGYAMELDLGL